MLGEIKVFFQNLHSENLISQGNISDMQISLAVLVKDNKVLIQKRYRKQRGMVFEFPGGAVDNGETFVEAAIRELKEETGIESTFAEIQFDFENIDGEKGAFVFLLGVGDCSPNAVCPARQQEFYWLTPDEIPLDTFLAPDQEFIVEHLPGFIDQLIKIS